jgi:protein-S-isoprenylcysteine O-methyltransferase Ste14
MLIFERIYVGVILTTYFIGFIVKNIATAKRTKLAIKGNSLKVQFVILTSTALSLITLLSIAGKTGPLLMIGKLCIQSLQIAGLVIISLALVLGIIALIAMRDSWRVGIREEQKTELIASGIFGYSRNPYFLSYLLMYFGIFLVFPTVVFLLFFLVFIILVHLMILDEEKYLTKQHGDSYRLYKSSVNRYISLKIKNSGLNN